MININKVRDLIQYIVRKHNSAHLDPAQFNLIVNSAQMTIFMERYGNPHEYQPGRPIPRIAYSLTQKVKDDLRQFIKSDTLIVKDGVTDYPSDYVHLDTIGYYTGVVTDGKLVSTPIPISVVDVQHEFYRLSSAIVKPSATDPICILKDKIHFHPKTIQSANITYLRQPKEAKWAFTYNSKDRPIYDEANSIHLEWPETVANDIVSRAVAYVGISIKDQDVIRYANEKTNEGL